jgi:hypothetical protein
MMMVIVQVMTAKVPGESAMVHISTSISGQIHIASQAQRCPRRRPKTEIAKRKGAPPVAIPPLVLSW